MAFAIHQHESATGIHVSTQSRTLLLPPSPLYPSELSQSIGFEYPASCIERALVIQTEKKIRLGGGHHDLRIRVCVGRGFSPPSLHRTQFSATKLLSNISCKWIFGFCLDRISLQSVGLSILLQMALFCSSLWLSNIPLYLFIISPLSIHLLIDVQTVFMSQLLWKVLQLTLGCMHLFE